MTVGDSTRSCRRQRFPRVPSLTCQSMSLRKASRSRLPSSCIGVTIATKLPVSIAMYRYIPLSYSHCPNLRGSILQDSPVPGSQWRGAAGAPCPCASGAGRKSLTAADTLDHRRPWPLHPGFLARDDAQPATNRLQQFSRPEQMVRVAGSAKALVAGSKSFVEQDAPPQSGRPRAKAATADAGSSPRLFRRSVPRRRGHVPASKSATRALTFLTPASTAMQSASISTASTRNPHAAR